MKTVLMLGVLLTSCTSDKFDEIEEINKEIEPRVTTIKSSYHDITVYTFEEDGLICKIFAGYNKGGISCVHKGVKK